MPKFQVTITGDVDVVVMGDGARVVQNIRPRPYSEAKRRLWDALQKAEVIIQRMPMEDPRWVDLVLKVQDAWERYNEME